jgi:MerR family transcriptional regulator, heat shock protein HspR
MSASDRDGGQPTRRTRRRTTTTASFDRRRGVFMISVAAELAEMHPQTLRMYEARGLINPQRSPKNTRLYSQEDVDRLRRIQRMTAEEGLNLAGVETVLELEHQLERARAELGKLRERAAELEQRMAAEVERVRRAQRAEIVPYGAYEAEGIAPPGEGDGERKVKIPIERSKRRTGT